MSDDADRLVSDREIPRALRSQSDSTCPHSRRLGPCIPLVYALRTQLAVVDEAEVDEAGAELGVDYLLEPASRAEP